MKPLNPFMYSAPVAQMGFMMLEAQAVVAMRMMGMAGLWSVTPHENTRMVSEKMIAVPRALMAANQVALSGGLPGRVATAFLKPLRQKTQTNAKRLGKRGPNFNRQ